jgi:4-amino-4-deoxy-L-arabinose transferase-like glycosyltransferase
MMDINQKRNFRVIALVGILYFIFFIFPNASTMGSDNPIVYLHTDEFVTYPIVERMLDFSPDVSTTWGRLIIYGDYHYGYPFYFLSMLTLLPLRLIQGAGFYDHTEVNILILRQVISVLPMILTAGVLTYVFTRFRKLWASLFTFLFLLTIPAVVRNNMHWWHPDALMMLAIALTFLFLDLDEYRLGKHFLLAATACGMASAIKLIGFFFFLTIPVYLLLAWRRKREVFRKIILSGLLFVGIMLIVIVLSNPFLFYKGPREDMLAIQSLKSKELSEGYTHEESLDYSLGPEYWRWTLSVSYGDPNFPVLLFLLLVVAGAASPNRDTCWLLLAWIVPIGIYLMWFVAPKPDHYLLPLLIPLYATAANGIEILTLGRTSEKNWVRWAAYAGCAVYTLILLAQCVFHISTDIHQYTAYFQLV